MQTRRWEVCAVSGWSSRCRRWPASRDRAPAAVEVWNGWVGTNRIAEPLIDARTRCARDETRFTSTNANCRRLIDAAAPAVSAHYRRLSQTQRTSCLADETGRLRLSLLVDTFTSCHVLATLTLQCTNNGQRKRPRPTQPFIPPGSVNEDQLRLGRKRQVWFIPGCAGKTARFRVQRCVHCSRRGVINIHIYLTSPYRYSINIDQPTLQACLRCRPTKCSGQPIGDRNQCTNLPLHIAYCISRRYVMEILTLFIHFIIYRAACIACNAVQSPESCLSVCPSVCQTRDLSQNGRKICPDCFIPHVRSFSVAS